MEYFKKCGHPKTLNNIYAHPVKRGRKRDGPIYIKEECRICIKSHRRKFKKTIKGKACEKRYTQGVAFKQSRSRWYASDKGKEAVRRTAQKMINKFPEKRIARIEVQKALQSKKIKKPNWCSNCLRITKSRLLHAHHYLGYQPKHWLDIKWFCWECHREEDNHQKVTL